MRILIADDDTGTRELLTDLLRHSGHSVTAVADGRAALDALAKERFEIVLMDEEMPVMNGIEAARAIVQAAVAGEKRPIIIGISGNTSPEDEQRCLEAGMDAFFSKPIRMAELFSVLAVLARRQASFPEPVESAAPEMNSEGLAMHLDRVTGGNQKITQSLLKTFLADSPEKLAAIRRAVSQGDAEALGTAAHSLKGSLALMGAQKAAGTARNLQAMGRLKSLGGAAAEFKVLESEFNELLRELGGMQAKTKRAPKPSTKKKSKPRHSPARPRSKR
jgi:two-component system, sensor histidine kinase and response regulator